MSLSRPIRLLLVPAFAIVLVSACNPAQESGGGSSTGRGGSSAGGSGGSSSRAQSGGSSGAGGTTSSGGSRASGGGSGSGGSTGSGGATAAGGSSASGGSTGSGGRSARGGSGGSGGATGSGGSSGGAPSGGSSGRGGATGSGGASASGGTTGSGGAAGSGGSTSTGNCSFTIISNSISTKMATVGIVEWSTTLANLSSARIVYTLSNAGAGILNKGGTAPVDLKKSNYRTLLLGLKQASDYTFHIEATAGGTTCKSSDYNLPKTGTLTGAPTVTRTTGASASSQAVGFIVTSSGSGGGGMGSSGNAAYILDADSAVVWYAAGPSQCSRALMDYEGVNMWMLSLNVQNGGGEMRFLSMDGQSGQNNVSGLSSAHHDFTVLPGKIAAMVWVSSGSDPESNLVEHASDGSGSSATVFKIGANLYAGGSSAFGGTSGKFHCNSIHYHAADDSYTIGDRNPNLYVKVKHDGTPVWQIGGTCTNAPAPKCASGTWQVNHGHDFDKNGNMLIFNNGSGSGGSGSTHIFEIKITESASAISFTTVKDFTSGTSSGTLGDVQRLPNGNTLITYSNSGQIIEVDPSWNTVQTLKGTFGYADWRETLYGPPLR
jgi:hypothetical protein